MHHVILERVVISFPTFVQYNFPRPDHSEAGGVRGKGGALLGTHARTQTVRMDSKRGKAHLAGDTQLVRAAKTGRPVTG